MSSNSIETDLNKIAANIPRYSAYFRTFYHHFTEPNDVNIRDRFYYEMIHIPAMTKSFIPNNLCSRCKLYVRNDDGSVVGWIESKPSTLPNAGTGVFACRSFRKDDIICIYLGRPYNPDDSDTYAFQDVNAADENGNTFIPYMLAHLLNQAVLSPPNCFFDGYKVIALRNIKAGEELLIYYNRDVFCPTCNTLMDKHDKPFHDNGLTCGYMICQRRHLLALCPNNSCTYRLCREHYCMAMID
jgi:hypothetical protein